MASDLVPLKIRIGLKPNGLHDYPDFNRLPSVQASGMDWSRYVDVHGIGWQYDKVSGHDHHDEAADSPRGTQWGCLLVPEVFADEAKAMFPDRVSELTEEEFERFYNERAHVNEPDVHEDATVLQTIAAKRAAGLPEDEDDRRALDVNHSMPGRRLNVRKTWARYKAHAGVTIAARARSAKDGKEGTR